MTGHLPTIDDCEFSTEPTRKGKFVGRVKQFPYLRTSPQRSSIDALDEIMTATREKLADLADAQAGHGPAPLPPQRSRA
ncbi:hypothetical protein BH11ACT6_BH11ACT6_34600 [soil metagenome]